MGSVLSFSPPDSQGLLHGFIANPKPLHLMAMALWCMTPLRLEASPSSALEDYVGRPDSSFSWKQVPDARLRSGTFRLDCTSQTWRDHVWKHQLLVVRPKEIRNPDIAFLYVTGDDSLNTNYKLLATVASQAGALAAMINRVPKQPLYHGRQEDALIAFTFDQYVRSGDATWPLLFPMVKSAVRGMAELQ